MGILYKLDFPSGKSYIGITKRSVLGRFNSHRVGAGARNATLVSTAWRKYGEPHLVILAIVENYLLFETEKKAIAIFKTFAPQGYNLTCGGDGSQQTLEGKTRIPNPSAQQLGALGGRAAALNMTAIQRLRRAKKAGAASRRAVRLRRQSVVL